MITQLIIAIIQNPDRRKQWQMQQSPDDYWGT